MQRFVRREWTFDELRSHNRKLAVLHENAQPYIAFLRLSMPPPAGCARRGGFGGSCSGYPRLGMRVSVWLFTCRNGAMRLRVPSSRFGSSGIRSIRSTDATGLRFALAHAPKLRVFDDRRRAVLHAPRGLRSLRVLLAMTSPTSCGRIDSCESIDSRFAAAITPASRGSSRTNPGCGRRDRARPRLPS